MSKEIAPKVRDPGSDVRTWVAPKVLVTERELRDRVNAKLAAQGEKILQSPQIQGWTDLGLMSPYPLERGKFYRIETQHHGSVLEGNIDLAALGRKLGVLADGEAVSEER